MSRTLVIVLIILVATVSLVYPEDINHTKDLFVPIIRSAAKEHDLDPALIRAIIMAESRYNPKAVSKCGAKGLMQLMPNTAESLGVDNIFDPSQNIHAGAEYFSKLLKRFKGKIRLALAAYNAGTSAVLKYRGVPPFPATKIYIKKVFRYHQRYKQLLVEADNERG